MLRETSFVIGGALTVALGIALVAGLVWAGAGVVYFNAWLAAAIAMGLGAFFIKVGRDAGEDRREALRRLEREGEGPEQRAGP